MSKEEERFYETRLKRYFDTHYKIHENDVEWFVNPAPNKWSFKIPKLGQHITLVCDQKGVVASVVRFYIDIPGTNITIVRRIGE